MNSRPNRFRKEDDPVDLAGLPSSEDVHNKVAEAHDVSSLRVENEYLENQVKEQQNTIAALTAEVERMIANEYRIIAEREQFREDNKTLLGLIDELQGQDDAPPWV